MTIIITTLCLAIAYLVWQGVTGGTGTFGPQIGVKAVLYLNTGSFGSPTWSAVSEASEVNISPKWKEGEGSTRYNRMVTSVKTQMEGPLTAKIRVDLSDANFAALWIAAHNDSIINMLILDAAITVVGAYGHWFDFQVFGNGEPQPLDGVLFQDFDLKPTVSNNPFSYVVMAANNAITSTVIGS